MEKKEALVTKWEMFFKHELSQVIYVSNSYMTEFCWWYNIKDKNKIKTKLDDGDEIGEKPDQFIKFLLSDFTYLDKLWCLWKEFKYAEVIYVKNEDINKKEVTIDPSKVRYVLGDGKLGKGLDEFSKIHANSFGPFNLENFINADFKILWILREPFMTPYDLLQFAKGEYDKLGGFPQASNYYKDGWNIIRRSNENGGNNTIATLLRISKKILEDHTSIISDLKSKSIEMSEEQMENQIMKTVMDHVCIIELNHFPGFCFSSWKSKKPLIKEWCTDTRKDEIEQLLNDFGIKIVIGDLNTLPYLSNNTHLFGNLRSHSLEEYCKKNSDKQMLLSRDVDDSIQSINGVALDSKKTKWFCWRHPSGSSDREKMALSSAIGDAIRQWGY